MDLNKIYNESCLSTLARMPDGFIDNCITSPPYFGLRDYGTGTWEGGNDETCEHWIAGDGQSAGLKQQTNTGSLRKAKDICPSCGAKKIDTQIGLEETPELYVAKLVEVFSEVKRVMKDDGTLWLNLGDSYAASGGKQVEQTVRGGSDYVNAGQNNGQRSSKNNPKGIKMKDLLGIPWLVAFALRESGWYLRQDIIWSKPNPMPESVTDRCTKAHEYIFLLSKSAKYYYDADAIKQPLADAGRTNWQSGSRSNGLNMDRNDNDLSERSKGVIYTDANKRSVWTVNTKPYSEAHFAVFPEELIEPCVLTTKPDAIIYDPFGGSGTTGVVALRARRKFILSELSPAYCQIAEKRLYPYLAQTSLF